MNVRSIMLCFVGLPIHEESTRIRLSTTVFKKAIALYANACVQYIQYKDMQCVNIYTYMDVCVSTYQPTYSHCVLSTIGETASKEDILHTLYSWHAMWPHGTAMVPWSWWRLERNISATSLAVAMSPSCTVCDHTSVDIYVYKYVHIYIYIWIAIANNGHRDNSLQSGMLKAIHLERKSSATWCNAWRPYLLCLNSPSLLQLR